MYRKQKAKLQIEINYIHNIKCEWMKVSTQNVEIGRLDENTRCDYTLSIGVFGILWIQRYKSSERKRMEEDNLKKAGVAILISDKIGFKNVNTDKQGHCIIIKGSIYQEYVAIINTHVPNSKAPK